MNEAKEAGTELQQLRAEKETKPRTWFAGPGVVQIEERVPREGESFSPDAYNVYNWKEGDSAPSPSSSAGR